MENLPSTNNILQFMKLIGQLKRVPRTGWVYRNVKQPESVSDHMYRMAMMSLTITDPTVDKDRCIKLALVHDMAECIVGDIAPSDNVSKAEKHRREEEAMKHLSGLLPQGLKEEVYGLWEVCRSAVFISLAQMVEKHYLLHPEYENQSSVEARLVKQFDLLEMILQAHEYEELEGQPGRLQEFFDSTNGRFHHPDVLSLVSCLNEERGCHTATAEGQKHSCNLQTHSEESAASHPSSHTS